MSERKKWKFMDGTFGGMFFDNLNSGTPISFADLCLLEGCLDSSCRGCRGFRMDLVELDGMAVAKNCVVVPTPKICRDKKTEKRIYWSPQGESVGWVQARDKMWIAMCLNRNNARRSVDEPSNGVLMMDDGWDEDDNYLVKGIDSQVIWELLGSGGRIRWPFGLTKGPLAMIGCEVGVEMRRNGKK